MWVQLPFISLTVFYPRRRVSTRNSTRPCPQVVTYIAEPSDQMRLAAEGKL
jgi:hypothetical protein